MIKMKNDIILPAFHPGEIVKEDLETLGISQNEFAIRTGILPKVVSQLLNKECNLTLDIAKKLSGFYGLPVKTWLDLQTSYDEYKAYLEEKEEINEEWELVKLFDKEFINKHLGIKIDSNNKAQVIKDLRREFFVSSLKNLTSIQLFSFLKTSANEKLDSESITLVNAWISIGQKKTMNDEVKIFDKSKLEKMIPYFQSLTTTPIDEAKELIKVALAECGVKYIELPYLKGSNISGATKWLAKDNAVLMVVDECRDDLEKRWFTFFHELGHVLSNYKRYVAISLKDSNDLDEEEIRANEFAKICLQK